MNAKISTKKQNTEQLISPKGELLSSAKNVGSNPYAGYIHISDFFAYYNSSESVRIPPELEVN